MRTKKEPKTALDDFAKVQRRMVLAKKENAPETYADLKEEYIFDSNKQNFPGIVFQRFCILPVLNLLYRGSGCLTKGGKANFEKWGNFDDIEIMYDWSGKTSDAFKPDMNNAEYVAALKSAMQNRVDAVEARYSMQRPSPQPAS